MTKHFELFGSNGASSGPFLTWTGALTAAVERMKADRSLERMSVRFNGVEIAHLDREGGRLRVVEGPRWNDTMAFQLGRQVFA
jgi:hypothetical protein